MTIALRERLEDARVRTASTYFIPEGETTRVLSAREVRQVLVDKSQLHEFEIGKYVDSVIQSARKVLSILVVVGKEEYFVDDFLHRELCDSKLPLTDSELSHTPARKRFLFEQYAFLAPVFTLGAIHKTLNEHYVLPFLTNEPLVKGEGAFGKVFRVKIHPAHQKMVKATKETRDIRGDDFFARKEFKFETSQESFKAEKRMLEMLSEIKHDNIVKLLATYTYGTVFNMIFPLAQMSLHEYLRVAKPPHSTGRMRAMFIEICHLASAIDSIHNFHLKNDDLDLRRNGYHHDLKPQNILVVGRTFQIADFGLARFKDLDETSKTDWKMGTRTYGPPESGEGSRNGRAYDMWSLGCILSEIVTFALLGPEGVREYAVRRETQITPTRSSDAFHDGTQLKIEVVQWFHELAEHQSFTGLLGDLLQVARSNLTPDPINRPNSNEFLERFRKALNDEEIEPTDLSLSPKEDNKTLFHDAAATGDLALLKSLIHSRTSSEMDHLRDLDVNERLPIHLAVQCGRTEVVEYLLEVDSGEAVTLTDIDGCTALHLAAKNEQRGRDVALMILEWARSHSRSLDLLSRKESTGKTALHLAIDKGNNDVADVIMNHTKDEPSQFLDLINDQDDYGRTVLDIARNSKNGHMLAFIERCLQQYK